MKNFEFSIMFFLGFITLLIIILGCLTVKTAIEKLYIIFLLSFNCIYAGLGIASNGVDNKYITSYLVFTLFLFIGLRLGFLLFRRNYKIFDTITQSRSLILYTVAILYWIILLIQLVYPTNKIAGLLNPTISINDVFLNQVSRRENTILYVLGIAALLIKPFYYVFLYYMRSLWTTVLLLLAEIYLGVVINGYIGRSGLLANLLIIILITIFKMRQLRDGSLQKKRHFGIRFLPPRIKLGTKRVSADDKLFYQYIFSILAIIIFVIFNMGLLFDYQNIRLGAKSLNINLIDKIDALLQIEFSFPSHYVKAEAMSGDFSPLSYFIWFVTLIIPKRVLPISNIMLLNYEFSTNLIGIPFGQPGFYVLLPSLLGEGILLYGGASFLHALFVGFVSGGFCSFFSKQKSFVFWNIYLLSQIMLMARGGSQGTLGVLVNSSILVVLFVLYEVLIKRKAAT